MLTDAALKCLKPKAKMYKVTDRDGMYVRVAPTGGISFRLDYRLNGRRETVHLGKYARDGITLARARELCLDAIRMIAEGRSPAIEKQREKRRIKEAKSFGEFGEKWLTGAPMADSTRAMRRAIFERELKPVWRNRLLTEITPDDLRAHCAKIVERGAPATAIHVRDILKQIYAFAILHGEKVANPADDVGPASIATFTPEDRALSPTEIRIMLKQLEHVATLPKIRLGMTLYLLTMVRKSELQDAVWDEVDFENAVWTIPKERMKRSKPHNVYLCRQTLDIIFFFPCYMWEGGEDYGTIIYNGGDIGDLGTAAAAGCGHEAGAEPAECVRAGTRAGECGGGVSPAGDGPDQLLRVEAAVPDAGLRGGEGPPAHPQVAPADNAARDGGTHPGAGADPPGLRL
jgi:hypothetical protein